MKVSYWFLVFNCLFVLYSNVVEAQSSETNSESPFSLEVSYVGDVVSNYSGGIKSGTTYLGLVNLRFGYDTQIGNCWKGGSFFVNVGNTHGGTPSEKLVGDFQGISNIEAGNHTFLYELWYKQNIGRFEIIGGLLDFNANFALSENGSLYTNSSFGIHSSISDNIPTPIFPLTALGLNCIYNFSEANKLKLGLFDGTPDDFDSNPYNVQWKLSKSQGFLFVTEFQTMKSLIKGLSGDYKFGCYYHQRNNDLNMHENNRGLYIVADQDISKSVSLFTQIGFSPRSVNNHNHFYSLGLNYEGILNKRPDDQLGFAFAYAGIDRNQIGSETVLELTYKLQLNDNIYIKPSFQYVVNPAGTDSKLDNALVGFIRLGIDFDK